MIRHGHDHTEFTGHETTIKDSIKWTSLAFSCRQNKRDLFIVIRALHFCGHHHTHYRLDLLARPCTISEPAGEIAANPLLTRQSSDTRQFLALEEFKRRSTTRRDMAELILNLVFGCDSCGITTSNDNNLAVLSGRDGGIESGLGTGGEGIKLEDSRWAVPEDGLGLVDGVLEKLDTLGSTVETHPT
jgi:hypothetical protein